MMRLMLSKPWLPWALWDPLATVPLKFVEIGKLNLNQIVLGIVVVRVIKCNLSFATTAAVHTRAYTHSFSLNKSWSRLEFRIFRKMEIKASDGTECSAS